MHLHSEEQNSKGPNIYLWPWSKSWFVILDKPHIDRHVDSIRAFHNDIPTLKLYPLPCFISGAIYDIVPQKSVKIWGPFARRARPENKLKGHASQKHFCLLYPWWCEPFERHGLPKSISLILRFSSIKIFWKGSRRSAILPFFFVIWPLGVRSPTSDLISRWMIPCLWMYSTAWQICRKMNLASHSVR